MYGKGGLLMTDSYHGNIILSNEVIMNGYVSVCDNVITYIGKEKPKADNYIEVDGYIAPGYVDIHCHASPEISGNDDPESVGEYHYKRGTTSMLITVYRGEKHQRYIEIIDKIKNAMKTSKNIRGMHFEGPYLNGKYGAAATSQDYPIKENYMEYINSGIIKQWTCSPEVSGTMELIADLKNNGIVPALGHSEASYKEVEQAVRLGAGIVTHIFDATGTTADKDRFHGMVAEDFNDAGTLNVSFNEACMLMDDMYYEVICDEYWVHVRREMLKLLIKTVGIDKVCAVTDCFESTVVDDEDINVVNGELSGSKLSMSKVAVNLNNAGYSMNEIAKMTARNPANAINLDKRGEIAVGNYAEMIVVDENYKFIKHLI